MKLSYGVATLTILILLGHLLVAQSATVGVAEMHPAPFGFIFKFQHPPGQVVGVYVNGKYHNWMADTRETKIVLYPSVINGVLTIDKGKIPIKITEYKYEMPLVAVNIPGPRDLVIHFANGFVYISTYRILYGGYASNTKPKDNDVIINPKVIDLSIKKKITYIVPVVSENFRVTIKEGNVTKILKLADLIGVDDTCIAFINNPPKTFGWTGGLIPTPICSSKVGKLLSAEYNGQPLYVIFSIKRGDVTIIFVFSKITHKILSKLGFIVPVTPSPFIHIVLVTVDNYYIYFRSPATEKLIPVNVVNAIDSTTIVKDKRYCIMPVGAKVLSALLWTPGVGSRHEMLPGEVILYTADNKYYLCTGDMSFYSATVSFSMPRIKEFHEPVAVRGIGGTAVVALGNGKIYYGTRFMIPYEEYSRNSLVAITHNPYKVDIVAQSIIETPFFWLSVLLGVLFAFLLLQKPREAPRRITIVWDVETPPPLEFPSKNEIVQKVKQYIDSYGVCPNDVELAMRGILVPASNNIKPNEEEIVCTFNTNVKTEALLRKLVDILQMGFWSFKRRGRNYGFTYTLIGDTMLVAYVYKQENERKPEELLLNAIRSAMKTYIGIPLHKKYAGLIIVAEPKMARRLRGELIETGAISESGMVRDIDGYISVKYPELDENERNAILEFTKRIPVVLVVGDKFTQVIDYLGELASTEYEAYLRRRGEKL